MGIYWRDFDSCTAVRIPTSRAHSESIVAIFEKPVDVALARKALEEAPGVKLVDDITNLKYPMPLTATGQYDVEVGRLRKNIAFDNALEFFVVGDQVGFIHWLNIDSPLSLSRSHSLRNPIGTSFILSIVKK